MIPTNGRPEFLLRAFEMIRAQDYPPEKIAQVIVIDDSSSELQLSQADLPNDVPIEYFLMSKSACVGAKRNDAAGRATGDVVVHWDDDDIYGPGRLRAAVAPIVAGRADLTVLTHALTYFLDRDELYAAKGLNG